MKENQNPFIEAMLQSNSTNNSNNTNDQINKTAEKTLQTIASTVLWIGIIGSLILFVTAIGMDSYSEKVIRMALFVSIIPTLLLSICTWGVLRVFANISLTLININSKLKD